MPVDRLLLRMGGESGADNVISAGDVLTLSVARSGYHVHTFRTYPAEIKGGPVMFQLRVGVQPLPSLGDQLDVLVAFNQEAWDLQHEDLRHDGMLIYDPAIVAAALAAGCRFFAGYPITPASDIMEELAKRLPKMGGAVFQTEDEIAAISAVVGASIGGVRAMTATSGPGFSLMQEMLGLATMAEVPLVVVDAQRAGPSTGMPTKMEQSDLNIALYGAHGDAPRIVLAPRSVEDCFYQTMHAFNLAETYQMPVIVLSDQSLSHRTETLTMPNPDLVPVAYRLRPSGDAQGYRRYELTESGISPMGVPGFDPTPFTATGLEHDETGEPNYTPAMHTAQMDKRGVKFERVAELLCELEPPLGCQACGAPEETAEVGVLTWGSTAGAAREAVEELAAEGYPVAALIPAVINPLPASRVRYFAQNLKAILVPEVNRSGQFAAWVKAHMGIPSPEGDLREAERRGTELPLISLNKYGGLPFTPGEIRAKVRGLLDEVIHG